MTPEERLQRLIEAERSQAPTAARADRGFERLQQALGAQVPPIDIGPVDPTLLAGSGALGKSAVAKLVALPWAAKVTAIVGVVASTGVLVGNQLGSANPPRPPAALASASPASAAARPRAKAAAVSSTKVESSLAAPASMPTPSAGSARPMPLPLPPAPETTASVSQDGPQVSPGAPSGREPSVKAFEDVPPKAAPAPAFDAELVLIKRAKAEFDAGRDQAAHAWLNEHARRFPAGVFAAEREGLIVLSTCRANPSAGGAGAVVFLRRYPQSPLAERIRRSCGLE